MQKSLADWYLKNFRNLPWRQTRDPYPIWISEIMLQQTRVAAVLPLYAKFLKAFPSLKALARAPQEEVLENWAGLGYYSRARNIHKAAQVLQATGFPTSYVDLLKMPGFGPYTARAVASFAFSQNVGVVDGNIVRVLSRLFAIEEESWSTRGKNIFQQKADVMVKGFDSSLMNQAMMELGATLCLPQNPKCTICPVYLFCEARKQGLVSDLPLRKNKRAAEYWTWLAYFVENKTSYGLVLNTYAPFLKNEKIWPGSVKKIKTKPKSFDFKHGITHHEIFVKVQKITPQKLQESASLKQFKIEWIAKKDLQKHSPFSLTSKVIEYVSSSSPISSRNRNRK